MGVEVVAVVLIGIAGLAIAVLLWGLVTYSRYERLQTLEQEAWARLVVELRRRRASPEPADAEQRVAASARAYNDAVAELSAMMVRFPANIVATMFSLTHGEPFDPDDPAAAAAAVDPDGSEP